MSYFEFLKTIEYCKDCSNGHWFIQKQADNKLLIMCTLCGKEYDQQ